MTAQSFPRTHVKLMSAIGMIALGGIFTAMAANATVLRPSWPVRVLLVACVVGGLLLAVAEFRMFLRVDDRGVHVRNLASAYDLEWDDIVRFQRPVAPFSRDGWRGRTGIRIITKQHGTKYVALWSQGRVNTAGFADDIIAELERWRMSQSRDRC